MKISKVLAVAVTLLFGALTELSAQCVPVITVQPQSKTACVNTPTSLTVTATGATSYQWYWSGTGGNPVPATAPWSGQTTNTLSMSSAVGGSYWVKVTNSCGTTTSNTVTVTVANPSVTASNTGPVCAGSTIGLASTSGFSSYSWTGPNSFTSTSQSPTISTNATTAMAGSYTVTATDANGCPASSSTSVTINAKPSFTVSNNGPVCVGSASSLTGPSGMSSYSWSGPNGFTSTAQSPTVSSSATTAMGGTYTLTATNSSGCSNSATTPVTINAVPVITVQPQNKSVCSNGSVTLSVTATGATSYIWCWSGSTQPVNAMNSSSAYSGEATNTLTITSPLGMGGSYWLRVVNSCGTTISNTVTLTVNSPSITASNSGPACVGSTVSLASTSGFSSYSWTGPNNFTSTSQSPTISASATSAMAGSYTVTVTDANGCTGSSSTSVTINAKPSFTVSNSGPVCAGSALSLIGPSGMSSYSWSGPNGFTSTAQSPTVSSTATTAMGGTYTLTATNSSGCSNSATTPATINTAPVITVQPQSKTVCSNGSVTLSVTATGATSYIWCWSGSTQPVNAMNSSTAYSGQATNALTITSPLGMGGNYWVRIVNSCGTTISNTVTLTVNTPTVTASNTGPVCAGSTIGLASTSGFSSYSWTGPNSYTSTSQSPTISASATAAMAGSYTVTATDANGCTASSSTSVTVNAKPSFTVSNNGPVCAGSALSLTGPSGMSSYSWSGPNGFTSTVQSPTVSSTAITAMGGTYTLTATNSNNCSNNATTPVAINTAPVITVQPQNKTVCSNLSTTLNITATGATSYIWCWSGSTQPANTLPSTAPWSGQSTNTLSISPTAGTGGNYWAKVVNTCGTTTSNTVMLTVTTRSVTASNTGPACTGGPVGLTSTSGFSSYAWTGPNSFTSTSQNPTITANATTARTGSYSVTVTDANGCTATASTNVTVNPPQVISVSNNGPVCAGAPITLTGPAGYTNYSWTGPNSFTSTLQSPVVATVTSSMQGNYMLNAITPGTNCAVTGTTAVTIDCSAKDGDMNYIITNAIQKSGVTSTSQIKTLAPEENNQSVQYFDGLGRLVQTVNTLGSPGKNDIVQPVVYDDFGREKFKYLPFASGKDGWFKDDVIDGTTHQYKGIAQNFYAAGSDNKIADDVPYSQTTFEKSPLTRVIKQGAPGAVWQPDATESYSSTDKTIKQSYETNGVSEVLLWTYSISSTYPFGIVNASNGTLPNYYAANELYKNKTKDEHQNEVITYVDKLGRTVLKRVQAVAGSVTVDDVNYASTYYIYDDLGQLVCVIPPQATQLITQTTSEYFGKNDSGKDDFLNRWAFRYAYDAKKRMIQKQVPAAMPGAEPVYMVYDSRDRLVLTQSGNERKNTSGTDLKQWLFTRYDAFNRPVLTGLYTADSVLSVTKMQQRVDRFYKQGGVMYETYIGNVGSNVHGYSNVSFPQVTDTESYFTVTYYDDYSFKTLFSASAFNYQPGELSAQNGYTAQEANEWQSVKGQVTGTKTKILGTNGWLRAVNYYDKKYRAIQAISENTKGYEVITNTYDFSGKIQRGRTSLYLGQPVSWTQLVSAQVQGDILSGTSTTNWSAGASSLQILPANADGWAEMTVVQNTPYVMFGLSDVDANANYTSIDYAMYVFGTSLRVYENGTSRWTSGTVTPGDVLRVERINGKVYYKRNGITVYTSGVASTTTLIADASLYNTGAKLSNARLSNTFSVPVPLQPFSYFVKRYSYDHAGRVTEIWNNLDGAADILLVKNEYNELGQLVDKKLHATSASGPFEQSVDYRYNIRGWLSTINNAALTSNNVNDDTNDLFGMEFAYNDDLGTGNSNNNPALDLRQYNGNISAVKWSNGQALGSIKAMAYNFKYDALNRLLSASHLNGSTATSWATGYYDESGFVYDLNGNIKHLQRKGDTGVLIDDLSYDYGIGTPGSNPTTPASNRLLYVTDGVTNAVDKAMGFYDGSTSGNDYSYDGNGNMLTDKNKGITGNITYNYLNLPSTVTRNTGTMTYLYDATGRKLSQVTSYSTNAQKNTEYVNAWEFENNTAMFLHHDEGRIVLVDQSDVFISDGDEVSYFTASASTTLVEETTNQQTYIKATTAGGASMSGLGISQVGGTFNVVAGERYVVKVKGYVSGTLPVNISIKGNGSNLVWPGAALLQNAINDAEVEQPFTIPPGVTQITIGLLWNTTSTAGGTFYINSLVLQQITNSAAQEYQYHLKDHLGNIRLTFTSQDETDLGKATMETVNASSEQSKFIYYDEAVKVTSTLFDHTYDGTTGATYYATRLSGTTGEKYGLARSLSVMPGDVINMEVFAKYVDGQSANWSQAFSSLMSNVAAKNASVYIDGGAAGSIGTQTFPFPGLLTRTDNGTGPKAYLNYLLFDRNWAFLTGGYARLSSNPKENGNNVAHERLAIDNLKIKQAGYIYIYLSNENDTPVEVYFDDLRVEQIMSPVIASQDYYPFGLTFNSYQRENSTQNNYLYNGKEKQDELNLGWMDYGARMYMADIGRWGVVDLLAEVAFNLTPYRYCFNNPMNYSDPSGLWEADANGNYSTDDSEEIEKFMSYLTIESSVLNNNPSIDDIKGFIKDEESGELGKLSDGSKLVSTVSVTGYDHGNHINWYTDKKSFDNAWHDVQGDLNPDLLDPRTLGHNIFGLNYPGPDNPKTYGGNDDYSVKPTLVELPGYIHDKEYDALKIKGSDGLFKEERALGADYRFVSSQLMISMNPFISTGDRVKSFILGVGLGAAATPKAINCFFPRGQGIDYNINPTRPFE